MKRQIPNILSCIRLLMIPAFILTYFNLHPGVSATIYAAAWVTDALDGYLARRNNWITNVGKILDPLADKCMQFAAAICFAISDKIFLLVAIPLFIKEISMLIAAIFIAKTQKVVVAASWYGKIATVLLFLCAFTIILYRTNHVFNIIIAVFMLACMIFSLLMYYFKDFKGKYKIRLFHK